MESNNYFEQLIVSYLSNNLDEEEEEYVRDWINASEENKLYFDELKRTWTLLSVKQIDVDKGWSRFTLAKNLHASPENEPFETNNDVVENSRVNRENRHGRKIKLFISLAVAASIMTAIVLGVVLIDKGNITPEIAVADIKKVSVELGNIEHQFNASAATKTIVLADSSEVVLYKNSSISYNKPFTDNRRAITLSGKANFKVSKDKSRPFTVTSGNITTTALGTQFKVTAFEGSRTITVRLFEGKVIIKPSNEVTARLNNNYYLLPGQELIYNNKNAFAKVRPFKSDRGYVAVKHDTKKEPLAIDHPLVPTIGKESWYMFNNQPLNVVFDQLGNMFHTGIIYQKKDVSKIYFIGKFNVSDSLSDILKQISTLNRLKVTSKNNTFIINK